MSAASRNRMFAVDGYLPAGAAVPPTMADAGEAATATAEVAIAAVEARLRMDGMERQRPHALELAVTPPWVG